MSPNKVLHTYKVFLRIKIALSMKLCKDYLTKNPAFTFALTLTTPFEIETPPALVDSEATSAIIFFAIYNLGGL